MARKNTHPADDTPTAEEGLRFEDAMDRLETLIEQIESGEVGLEDAIAKYEQGTALVKRCRTVLDRAEQRITELTAKDLSAQAQAPDQDDAAL